MAASGLRRPDKASCEISERVPSPHRAPHEVRREGHKSDDLQLFWGLHAIASVRGKVDCARMSTVLHVLCAFLTCCAQGTLMDFTPEFIPARALLQVGQAQGTGTQIVESFNVEISIETNNTIGPLYDDTKALTWQGQTEVKLQVTWKNAASHPWIDTDFLLSKQVRTHLDSTGIVMAPGSAWLRNATRALFSTSEMSACDTLHAACSPAVMLPLRKTHTSMRQAAVPPSTLSISRRSKLVSTRAALART